MDRKGQENQEIEDITQELVITKILHNWDKVLLSVKDLQNNDIIAFVGPTKAGKSTLINCILGQRLVCKRDEGTEDIRLFNGKHGVGPLIGGSGESETHIPKQYSPLEGTLWPIWDFPGFGDNKGTDQEIANAGAYAAVLEPMKSVRFVLVVTTEDIKSDNPMPFFKLLNDIFLLCPNVSESVCLVATKGERGAVDAFLKKAVNANFGHADKDNMTIVSNAKNVINSILVTRNFIDFKAPIMDADRLEITYKPPNLDNIISMIRNLRGTKITSVPIILSDQAKKEILILYAVMYRTFKKEIDETCNCLENYFKTDIEKVLSLSDNPTEAVASLKITRRKIMQLEEKTVSLENFFIAATEMGIPVKKLKDRAKKFAFTKELKDRAKEFAFTEKFQNKYHTVKGQKVQGESEFLTRIRLLLRTAAANYEKCINNNVGSSSNNVSDELEFSEYLGEESVEEGYMSFNQNVSSLNLEGDRELETLENLHRSFQYKNSMVMNTIKGFTVRIPEMHKKGTH